MALVLVAGFVVLTVAGRATDQYVLFVSGPLVSTIIGAALANRVRKVQETADIVKVATDGILSKRLDTVDDKLDSAAEVRQIIAQLPTPAAAIPPAAAGPVHDLLAEQRSPGVRS